jgi:transcriptional regulator with XRE-family HTH domain
MSEVSAERPEGTSGKTGKRPLKVPQGPGYAHARAVLGKAVRVRREKAGLTQAAAAELLGISERTLRDWERGEGSLWTGGAGRTVDYVQMQKLKDAYLCAWADLVPRNQYPSAPLDPVARREFFIRRNAAVQGNDPDEAVERVLGARRSAPVVKGE